MLDLLIGGYENDNSIPNPVTVPTAVAAPSPAPAPSVAEILSGTPSLPQVPKGDASQVLPLMLLNFASQVAQRRAPGQSRIGQALEAANASVQYGMNEKRQIEDRALAEEGAKRRMAIEESNLKTSQLNQKRIADDVEFSAKTRPLELQRLEQALEHAKTAEQVKAIELKIKGVAAKYAEQFAQADLATKRSQAGENAAQAEMHRQHAEFYRKSAEELLEKARIQAAGKGTRQKFKAIDVLPGERPQFEEETTGQVFYGPMSPAEAVSWAKRQAKATASMTPGSNEQALVQQFYNKALTGTMPKTGEAQESGEPAAPTPTTAASPGPAQTGGPVAPAGKVPNEVLRGKDGRLWLVVAPGQPMKPISETEFNARRIKGANDTPPKKEAPNAGDNPGY